MIFYIIVKNNIVYVIKDDFIDYNNNFKYLPYKYKNYV